MALGEMVYMNADEVTNRLLIKQPRSQGSLCCFEKEPWLQLFMWLWQWTPQQSKVNVLSFSLVDGATEYEVRFEAVTCIQAHAICFEKVNKGAIILDKIKWNSKPPSPPNQGWSRAKGKNAPFSHPRLGGGGGRGVSRFSIYFVQDYRFVYYCSFKTNFCEHRSKISNSTARLIFNLFCVVWIRRYSLDYTHIVNFIKSYFNDQ